MILKKLHLKMHYGLLKTILINTVDLRRKMFYPTKVMSIAISKKTLLVLSLLVLLLGVTLGGAF